MSTIRADLDDVAGVIMVRRKRATEKIKEQGELVRGANGVPVENPWLRVEELCVSQLIRLEGSSGKQRQPPPTPWSKPG